MNAPLPSFFRPPSTERDQTIMRPPDDDEFCLQLPNSSDYLIPISEPRSAAERLLSEATGVTMSETITTCSAPKMASPAAPKLLHHHMIDSSIPSHQSAKTWETSFMMPHSKSDQPLLMPDGASMDSLDVLDNGPPVRTINYEI